jgi:hypothetical protein
VQQIVEREQTGMGKIGRAPRAHAFQILERRGEHLVAPQGSAGSIATG